MKAHGGGGGCGVLAGGGSGLSSNAVGVGRGERWC